MYGMMPSAKMVSRRSWPPLNRSTKPRKLPRFWSKNCDSKIGVDARRGNMPAQAVNRQQPKREQNALAQIGNAKYVG